MERILKILGIAVIIFLLVYWISDISKGCNSPQETTDTEQVNQLPNQDENSEDIDLDEDIFGDEQAKTDVQKTDTDQDSNASQIKSNSEEESVDDFIDYSGEAKESTTSHIEEKSTPKAKTDSSQKPKSSYSGRYLVVAGSYLVKDNANKMKRKLYNLGYNAEIVNFDLSQYYSVLAGRFSTQGDAKSAVTILKRSGIDCYVHRKK